MLSDHHNWIRGRMCDLRQERWERDRAREDGLARERVLPPCRAGQLRGRRKIDTSYDDGDVLTEVDGDFEFDASGEFCLTGPASTIQVGSGGLPPSPWSPPPVSFCARVNMRHMKLFMLRMQPLGAVFEVPGKQA